MAKCKFCGQPVKAAPVFHPACWEQRANKVIEEFCDKYCRFPREIKDHDNLKSGSKAESLLTDKLKELRKELLTK